MKSCLLLLFLLTCFLSYAQTDSKSRNIIIITTDGFRWQEVFTGADSALISNSLFVSDTGIIKDQFWDENPEQRRKKLMPFLWNVIAKSGQLYGNRLYDNYVNCKNFYKISYPGYNEIFTGYPDPKFIPNTPVDNSNINVLEFINKTVQHSGKVIAFTSWNIFPYILNEQRSGFTVNSGYENADDKDNNTLQLINQVQDSVHHKSKTRYDDLTFLSAMEYIKSNKPHVVFIGLGETDEFAHSQRYDLYLQQAAKVDEMIGELWYYIQTDPFYKNNTDIIITTDHGRGKSISNWNNHGLLTNGSGQAWLALLGPDCAPMGEIKTPGQLYQAQLASTIAAFMGIKFEGNHKTAKPIDVPSTANKNSNGYIYTSASGSKF